MIVERRGGAFDQPTFGSWKWLDVKIATVLGDLDENPSPVQDPRPARAASRILFMILLAICFLLLLVYHYKESPDVTVEQVHHLQRGQRNYNFPIRELHDLSPESNMTWRKPITCPCSTITVKWRDFVRFYMLHSNSTAWNVTLTAGPPPSVTVPFANNSEIRNHVVRDPNPVTAEQFCSVSTMWPIPDAETGTYIKGINGPQCVWLASSVFPDPKYEDTTRSATSLETPSLLNREVFNMRVAALARVSALKRRQQMDMSNRDSVTLQLYTDDLAELLTGLFDRDTEEFDEWESYHYGALHLRARLATHVGFNWTNPMVFINHDAAGLIFLHTEINWLAYYEACAPMYCEVTNTMSPFRQAYRALGLLGGVAAIILGVVSALLWPAVAFLLSRSNK